MEWTVKRINADTFNIEGEIEIRFLVIQHRKPTHGLGVMSVNGQVVSVAFGMTSLRVFVPALQ